MSSSAASMIGAIMGAAADVIARIVELVANGQVDVAKGVVDRFVATTKTQLANDRSEADDELRRRFPGSSPPG